MDTILFFVLRISIYCVTSQLFFVYTLALFCCLLPFSFLSVSIPIILCQSKRKEKAGEWMCKITWLVGNLISLQLSYYYCKALWIINIWNGNWVRENRNASTAFFSHKSAFKKNARMGNHRKQSRHRMKITLFYCFAAIIFFDNVKYRCIFC